MSTSTPPPDTPPTPPPVVNPLTPPNAPGGKQQHGNAQIAMSAGGSLISTPGAVLP